MSECAQGIGGWTRPGRRVRAGGPLLLALGLLAGLLGCGRETVEDAAARTADWPYYGGDEGFDDVFAMLKSACEGLLDALLTPGHPQFQPPR